MNWPAIRKAVLGTLGAIGIWIAAVVAVQPNVPAVPLPLKQIGTELWVGTNDYQTVIAGYIVKIPAGLTNDGASIPKPAQKLLGITRFHPAIRRGAYCHDYFYRTKSIPKEKADYLLWRACLEDGMQPDKARAVYEAVQLYGFIAWDR